MFIELDDKKLLEALEVAVLKRLRPDIQSPDGQHYCDAIINVTRRHRVASHSLHQEIGDYRQAAMQLFQNTGGGYSGDDVIAALERERKLSADISRQLLDQPGDGGDSGKGFLPLPSEQELTRYLQARFPGSGVRGANIREVVGGNSKQTILFDGIFDQEPAQALVMRRDHPNQYAKTCVCDEIDVLRFLFAAGFPVAEPLWAESSSDIIAGNFIVTRRVRGKSVGDYFHFDDSATIADPATLLADIMARLHSLDTATFAHGGITPVTFREKHLLEKVDEFHRLYRDSCHQPAVSVETAFLWLKDNARLGMERPTICHGDPGCHNMMVDGAEVTALLDWELSHVGSAAEDLSACRGYIEKFAPYELFLGKYQEFGAELPSIASLNYYQVYRIARSLSLIQSAASLFNQGKNNDVAVMRALMSLNTSQLGELSSLMIKVLTEPSLNERIF